jgi:TolB-like protein
MSEQKNGLSGIIQELRNRRVFRAVAVYLGAGFAILEAADIVIPMLGLPGYVVKAVFWTLIGGFPLAISLAWTFQFTPEGLRRSPKSGEKQTEAQKPFTGNSVIIMLLVVIVGLLAYPRIGNDSFENNGSRAENMVILDAKAVAVLPFTNFSSNEEDAYFADGIHDDILTQLSKIGDLKIISRTTMIKYKDSDKSMTEIADEVGAANILEGSVRRAGDQVRIVAQLIKAKSDEHLWAETYDREYADIFSIQTDVARKIASALKSTLTPEEEQKLDNIPTTNMEAYDYFLRGNTYWYTKTTKEGNLRAAAMYQKAVDLDPSFGLAYARLSIVHSVLYQARRWDPTPERKALAESTLKKARSLIPNHAETHFAQGVFYDWCLNDKLSALAEFEMASQLDPSRGEFAQHAGQIYVDMGNWEKAGIYLKAAYDLEPDAVGNAAWWGGYNFLKRNYDTALQAYLSELRVNPENAQIYRFLSAVYQYGYGDSKNAIKVIDDGMLVGDDASFLKATKFWYLIDERDFSSALQLAEVNPTPASFYYRAIAHYFQQDNAPLAALLDSAAAHEEDVLGRDEDNAYALDRLSLIRALQGKKQEAIKQSKLAGLKQPLETNALDFPDHSYRLAEVYSLTEEPDQAFDILESLLEFPNSVSLWRIKLNPFFDALRDHPRYSKLIAKYGVTVEA